MTPNNRSQQTVPTSLLQRWEHIAHAHVRTPVLPDGCRDLIVRTMPDGRCEIFVTELDDTAYTVESHPGERFTGYRFHPAARFNATELLHAAIQLRIHDEEMLLQAIDDLARINMRLHEALAALSTKPTVLMASRTLGVSERTLERLVRTATGRTPAFWKALARLRRTARTIIQPTAADRSSLAETAADCGYADQAHMNRAFRHWLGVTPSQFRDTAQLHAALLSGYD